jgi:hypothetical protein
MNQEERSSWEADSLAQCQKIPRLSYKINIYYIVQKSQEIEPHTEPAEFT